MVLVSAVDGAAGGLGAAAALACAGSSSTRPSVLIDVGGRVPRPTLLSSPGARSLEKRLAADVPGASIACRGRICFLTVEPDDKGLASAATAAAVAQGHLVVAVAPAARLSGFISRGPRFDRLLLRVDLDADIPIESLDVRLDGGRHVAVRLMGRRLSWVAERRALFGALDPDADDDVLRWLTRLLTGTWAAAGTERVA